MKPLKFHSPRSILVGILTLTQAILSQAYAVGSPHNSPAPGAKHQEHSQLKAALLQYYSQLGPLEPWQERLWQEEVLPQAPRFIKDYRALPSGIQADVDIQGVQSFLKFYAPVAFRSSSSIKPKLLVYLNTQSQCQKCMQSLSQIKSYVSNVLDNRGFQPLWVSDQEMVTDSPGLSLLEDRLNALSRQRKERGGMIITWTPASDEEIDTAHADELRFTVDVLIMLKGMSKIQRKKEILENVSFISTVSRLVTDIFTDLGSQWDQLKLDEADSVQSEVFIEIDGARDFEQYLKIKSELTEQLKSFGVLSDRAISKKDLTLVVFTQTKKDEIQRVVFNSKSRWDLSNRFQVSVH